MDTSERDLNQLLIQSMPVDERRLKLVLFYKHLKDIISIAAVL